MIGSRGRDERDSTATFATKILQISQEDFNLVAL